MAMFYPCTSMIIGTNPFFFFFSFYRLWNSFMHLKKTKQKLTIPRWVYDKWDEETWKRMKRVRSRETMREFQGKLERSLLKRPVRPISVITRLSLSPSMIVRSKSNTTTVSPAIPSAGVGFSRYPVKRAGFSLSSLFDFLLWD